MSENTNQNTQQTATPTLEGTGGKLFTQDEVNKIVSDRLAREREKLTQQTAFEEREKALQEREKAFEAKEARAAKEAAVRAYYQEKGVTGRALEVAMKGSGPEIDALELADGQVKDFTAIDSLIGGVFAGLVSKTVTVGAPVTHPPSSYQPTMTDALKNAFQPKI